MAVAAVVLVAYGGWQLAVGFDTGVVDGRDFGLYRDVTSRWLAGGAFYQPWQLQGPYEMWSSFGAVLYPPVALYLFAPFTVLPAALWYVIPLATTGWLIIRWRPNALAWPVMALCFAWPPTIVYLAHGNPDIWIVAFIALGLRYRGAAVLVFLKPSLFPFAFLGARHRRWWLAAGVLGLACIPFGAMWIDWITAVRGATDASIVYSIQEVPMLLIPVVGWFYGSSGGRVGWVSGRTAGMVATL